jgi:hypothetical protein
MKWARSMDPRFLERAIDSLHVPRFAYRPDKKFIFLVMWPIVQEVCSAIAINSAMDALTPEALHLSSRKCLQ